MIRKGGAIGFLLAVSILKSLAQYEPLAIAPSTSPANASTAYSLSWTPFHNPSALTLSNKNSSKKISGSASILYHNRYALKELSSFCGAGSLNTPYADFGVAVAHFGIDAYSENIAGLAVSRSFTRYAVLSVALDYYFITNQDISGYNGNVICEIGFMSEPLNNFIIGLHAFNPLITGITVNGKDFYIGSIYSLGLSYTFVKKVTLLGQVDKDIRKDWDWHVGVEWKILKWLSASLGCQGTPFVPDLGLGFEWKGLTVSSRFCHHNTLGFSSTCSLTYCFR